MTGRSTRGAGFGAVLAALAGLAGGCSGGGSGPSPRRCAADPECGAGAWCVGGACVADAPPVPEMNVPSSLRSNVEVVLTATVTDPDPRDSVSLAWSIVPESGCEAEVAAPSEPTLRTIFWCPGTYRIELAATDRAGLERRISRTVAVEASPGAPTVVAGPEIAAGHRCAGDPLACVVLPASGQGSIQLSAAGTDPENSALVYQWIPVAPPGVDATVTFAPDAAAPQPTVRIDAAGGAISGTWRFKARVQDAQGLLAQAVQVIEVANLAPVVVTTALEVPHRYVAPSFVVDAPLAPVVEDPEGDPVVLSLEYAEPPASGCTALVSRPDAAPPRFQASCPDHRSLIGGVERSVTISAVDANGASTSRSVPLTILNTGPTVSVASGQTPVIDHSVADCPEGRCFVATGTNPFLVTDPDGDPLAPIALEPVIPPGSQAAAETGLDERGGWFRIRAPLGAPTDFIPGYQTTPFTVVGTARDPWAAGRASTPIVIANRAPVLRTLQAARVAAHRYDAGSRAFLATGPVAAFEDPDGDPLTFSGIAPGCSGVGDATGVVQLSCSFPYDWTSGASNPLALFLGRHEANAVARDPWTSTSTATSLTVVNTPPITLADPIVIDSCTCTCAAAGSLECSWQWAGTTRTFPVASDAEGDPLNFNVASSNLAAAWVPSPAVCLGGSCTAPLTVNSPGTYTLTTTPNDGASAGVTRTRAVDAYCSRQSTGCSP